MNLLDSIGELIREAQGQDQDRIFKLTDLYNDTAQDLRAARAELQETKRLLEVHRDDELLKKYNEVTGQNLILQAQVAEANIRAVAVDTACEEWRVVVGHRNKDIGALQGEVARLQLALDFTETAIDLDDDPTPGAW